MIDPEKCCGCGACESVCGKGAITLCPNEKGFLAPKIDSELCVECGLCDKVCPEQNDSTLKAEKAVYALKAPKKIRRESQSGGAFALLAEKILANGGVVYGAAVLDDISVGYLRVTDSEKLGKLKTSKYVQADNRKTYESVLSDLKEGKEVLYSGTPCYVAGLYRYLNIKKCELGKLCTIDLVCHGVPSPKLYSEYIELESKKAGKRAKGFVFRDKQWSLNEKYSKIIWDEHNSTLLGGYLRMFASRLSHRPSCLVCKYACRDRVGDITLGDFWGIETLRPDFDDNRGVSLAVANTEKGEAMLASVLGATKNLKFTKDDAVKKQPSMQKSAGKPEKYDEFWKFYSENGLEASLLEYCNYKTAARVNLKNNQIKTLDKRFLRSHIRGRIKTSIPSFLRKAARKIVK